jgi:hypothetical protein
VQRRGVSVLNGLALKNTGKGRLRAAQALAKVVITTNPTLIPEPQMMDTIGPLVNLCHSDDQLQQVRERVRAPPPFDVWCVGVRGVCAVIAEAGAGPVCPRACSQCVGSGRGDQPRVPTA